MTETDKMLLDLPTVSTTLGPEWATMLNTLLELVDEHDHSTDKGSNVTPAGILINATLSFVNQMLTNADQATFPFPNGMAVKDSS